MSYKSGFSTFFQALALLLVWLAIANAARIPVSQRPPPTLLAKRAVVYGDAGNVDADSSICNSDQRTVLERSMTEAANLAKAGSDGLALILDMLTDEKTEYNKLERKEKDRYMQTYFTLFGKITKRNEFETFKTRASSIKTILDRVVPLDPESWPSSITFFCDSTYYQDKDPNGDTWDQVTPPKDAPAKDGREWKYDYDKNIWSEVNKKANCAIAGSTVAAWTLTFNAEQRDRMTFCPAWFTIIQAPEAGKSFTDLDPATDIAVGTKLKDFTRKSGRIFLHEHLHTYTFNQVTDKSVKLGDVDDPNSYGPDNAQRLGKEDAALASRNIENVVYWCIAMFYNTWNWSTLSAATP